MARPARPARPAKPARASSACLDAAGTGGGPCGREEATMKLFMVADMEGATGITHRDQLLESGGKRYWDGCGLLTGDINAVVEGAVSEGVTEVIVSEGHANMRNVLVEQLHPAARVVRGPAGRT